MKIDFKQALTDAADLFCAYMYLKMRYVREPDSIVTGNLKPEKGTIRFTRGRMQLLIKVKYASLAADATTGLFPHTWILDVQKQAKSG